jgi:hypothetical protein
MTDAGAGIACHEITTENALRYGWAAVRALRLLWKLGPIPPP